MSGRKGNLASRSLAYRTPEVPSFLRALKAQVASSDRYANSHSNRGGDELDSLVTSTSSSSGSAAGKRKARDDDYGLDSEDEMNGAQVVVLKDGKHLSHEEALSIKAGMAKQEQAAASSSGSAAKAQNIATSSGPAKKKREAIGGRDEREKVSISSIVEPKSSEEEGKKRGGGGLEDVKRLILKDREAHSSNKSKQTDAKEKSKEEKRKEKNAKAKKLKAKAGKGLSFDLDD